MIDPTAVALGAVEETPAPQHRTQHTMAVLHHIEFAATWYSENTGA